MDDKEYLLKLYKLKNSLMDSMLYLDKYHRPNDEKSKTSIFSAGQYRAYEIIVKEVNNLIDEVESQANSQ